MAVGASVAALAPVASAETGTVSAVGTGHDTGEATANLLRGAVTKYFKDEPAAFTKAILQSEIIPNAGSFVQSYRLLESGKGSVSISANVDLDVIKGLLSLTAPKLGAEPNTKAVVLVRGVKLPDAALKAGPANPFAVLEAGARERFSRRSFEPVVLKPEDAQALSAGEDVTSPELLRGLGARSGARLALGISTRREQFENENSHRHEERFVLTANLVDVKTGSTLGHAQANVNEPTGRRDQYVADLTRVLENESKDLFQDLFVSAGRKVGPAEVQADFALLRVQFPPAPALVAKFRSLLESGRGLKSVTEYSVRRGALDYAVRPKLSAEALQKIVAALPSDDFVLKTVDTVADDSERRPDLSVQLAPKPVPAPGGPSAMDEEDAINAAH